jgi:hypothetical protein
MGASPYQHSKFSIWTNLAYSITGVLLFLMELPVIALSFITLGIGSFWYHNTGSRNAVVFDYFGMFIVLSSIIVHNLTIATLLSGPLLYVIFFLSLVCYSPFLKKAQWNFTLIGIGFIGMTTSAFLAMPWGDPLIGIGLFALSLFFRSFVVLNLTKPENEGFYHGLWHLLTCLAFLFFIAI